MEELSIYFEEIDAQRFRSGHETRKQLGDTTIFFENGHFPEVEEGDIAIIGVLEGRGAESAGTTSEFPNTVRGYLYDLFSNENTYRLLDLGNIRAGNTVEDTYHALAHCVQVLVKNKIIPVVIGGSQDLTYAQYQGYEKLEQTVNLLAVDQKFDLGDVEGELTAESYLGKIVLHQPNYLFNFSNIGYQSYFVDGSTLELMNGLYFDSFRLGEVRKAIQRCEPIIRNADMLSFDLAAIRNSDAPGVIGASPHGFYGEEACQISRYAGMSDKLTSIGYYNGGAELSEQTSHLLAQMIWYFCDGYYARKKDYPIGSKADYVRYRVHIKDGDHELLFLKSPKSDRWWLEVPYPPDERLKLERHAMVPCNYSDYEEAMQDEMPDIWWRTYKKLF